MKPTLSLLLRPGSLACLLVVQLGTVTASRADILAGPVTNAASGHVYYLLSPTNWSSAESEAVSLGGHLATINDAEENAWVFNRFATNGGVPRSLWLGLNDAAVEGTWVWVGGEAATYRNWAPGEPNNGGGYFPDEDQAVMRGPALSYPESWNDAPGNQSHAAVVELIASTPPSNARIYDVAADFSTNGNPNGVWSYGYSTTLGGAVSLHNERGHLAGLDYWRTDLWLGVPGVYFNPANSPVTNNTAVLGPRQLSFHPGPKGEFCLIRFTAPSNGQYHVSGVFTGVDTVGTTTDVHILVNGVIFDGWVNGYGAGSGPTFNLTAALHAEDRIDFAVGRGDNNEFSFDSTGLAVQIALGSNAPPAGIAPTITSHPQSRSVSAGTNVTFFVSATGTSPLSYQWRRNGTNLAGATGTSLTLTNVQPANAGTYSVRVTNAFGAVTSSNAVLTVSLPPSPILAGPITNAANEHVYFLIASNTWTGAEAQAVTLGGHLVTLNDAAENEWVLSTFGNFGGLARPLWIGLNDAAVEGQFVWVSGEAAAYRNWMPGEPNNGGGYVPDEDYVGMRGPGLSFSYAWNDTLNSDLYVGVVEIGSAVSPTNCVSAPAGLVSWWRAEGNANDSAGTNNGTTLFGVAYAAGEVGQAFDFNDPSRRVSVPDSPDFRLTNAFTVEGWIYPRQSNSGIIFIRGDNRYGLDAIILTMLQSPGNVAFQIEDAVGQSASLQAPVQLNQWQHIAATLDGDTGVMRIYVNGVVRAQTNTVVRPMANLDPSQQPAIGIGNHGGTAYQFPFNGMIDEISLYSRALSSSEIEAIYHANGQGKCADARAPLITLHPTNQTVAAGGTVTFTVTATGTAPLSYQWRRNETNLERATGTSLTLTNVQLADAGSYSVRVTNAFGGATSSNAVLTVAVAAYDVSADYSLAANPNGVWRYGAVSNLAGPLTLLTSARTFGADNGVPIGEWNPGGVLHPHVNKVLGPGTAVSAAGGAFVAAAGTVYFTPGEDGTAHNFGVIRFTVPTGAGGDYRIVTAVQPLFDGDLSADADFHLDRNGVELFGAVLGPNQGTGYSNTVALAAGDTIDFAIGRGADGMLGTTGLKIQATVAQLAGTLPIAGTIGVTSLVRESGASARLYFAGVAGNTYTIQASTNLINWEVVGTSMADSNGVCGFEDLDSARFPCRYYRVVVP